MRNKQKFLTKENNKKKLKALIRKKTLNINEKLVGLREGAIVGAYVNSVTAKYSPQRLESSPSLVNWIDRWSSELSPTIESCDVFGDRPQRRI